MIHIDKSVCGRFVRVTVNGKVAVLTIGEFSRMLSAPGQFHASSGAADRTYL